MRLSLSVCMCVCVRVTANGLFNSVPVCVKLAAQAFVLINCLAALWGKCHGRQLKVATFDRVQQ